MRYAIITSEKDIASMNIRKCLLSMPEIFRETEEEFDSNKVYYYAKGNAKLYTIKCDSVNAEELDKKIVCDMLIFATKHKSDSGRRVLSVHAPGNWNKAMLGGKEKALCIAPAQHLKYAMKKLEEYSKESSYEVSCEQTHHGPYLDVPTMFIEIGSGKEQWEDSETAMMIANTIIDLTMMNPERYDKEKSAVFFGGIHYNAGANKVFLRTGYMVGHICAKYNFDDITCEVVEEAFEKQVPKAKTAIVDWKGMGKNKGKVMDMLEKIKKEKGIKIIKLKELMKTETEI